MIGRAIKLNYNMLFKQSIFDWILQRTWERNASKEVHNVWMPVSFQRPPQFYFFCKRFLFWVRAVVCWEMKLKIIRKHISYKNGNELRRLASVVFASVILWWLYYYGITRYHNGITQMPNQIDKFSSYFFVTA